MNVFDKIILKVAFQLLIFSSFDLIDYVSFPKLTPFFGNVTAKENPYCRSREFPLENLEGFFGHKYNVFISFLLWNL